MGKVSDTELRRKLLAEYDEVKDDARIGGIIKFVLKASRLDKETLAERLKGNPTTKFIDALVDNVFKEAHRGQRLTAQAYAGTLGAILSYADIDDFTVECKQNSYLYIKFGGKSYGLNINKFLN